MKKFMFDRPEILNMYFTLDELKYMLSVLDETPNDSNSIHELLTDIISSKIAHKEGKVE